MKTIYVEAFSGISGNMFLGALLGLGAPLDKIKEELAKMQLGSYEIIHESVNKCGIQATYFNVRLPHEYEHEHEHGHEHGHTHEHEHEHEQGHAHKHEHGHEHGHTHEHRNLEDILQIINASGLSREVKSSCAKVFELLAQAEAKVHGKPLAEVHFHEVGAVDTIIDIVGSVLALEYLGVKRVYISKMQTGTGFVKCAHGMMPIPAPATAELLKTLTYYQGELKKELVTPTGAALMAALAVPSPDVPEGFTCSAIAYGAGTWDLPIPNAVRVQLGEINGKQADDALLVLETNIDDMSGEIYPYVTKLLFAHGALDVWLTPIFMKKGRPAYKLSALADREHLQALCGIILKETTSLGVRYGEVRRTTADRHFVSVRLGEEEIAVKTGSYQGKLTTCAAEYEDCVKLAEKTGRPLKEILAAACQKTGHSCDE